MRTFSIACVLAASLLAIPACSSNSSNNEAQRFDTLADCYTEHTTDEHLTVQDAIVVCCIDHPIGTSDDNAVHPSCGQSAADCTTHVSTELPNVAASDVDTACQTYIGQISM